MSKKQPTVLKPEKDLRIAKGVRTIKRARKDKIIVYKDPYFGKKPEGEATIEKVIASDGQRDLCLVTLTSNGLKVRRWIKKEAV